MAMTTVKIVRLWMPFADGGVRYCIENENGYRFNRLRKSWCNHRGQYNKLERFQHGFTLEQAIETASEIADNYEVEE